jgi:hypothetical protein
MPTATDPWREEERLQNLERAERREVEFPTEGEWELALEAIDESLTDVINVSWKVARIAEFKGAHAPTFEEIGRAHAYAIELEGRLEELDGYVRQVRESLPRLDYVRALNNEPDDA